VVFFLLLTSLSSTFTYAHLRARLGASRGWVVEWAGTCAREVDWNGTWPFAAPETEQREYTQIPIPNLAAWSQ